MPVNRDNVLLPLGGEDNLRLMCDAEDFQYVNWDKGFKVSFTTPKYYIVVTHFPDQLNHSNCWALGIWNRHRTQSVHHSTSILDPKLLARTFEWATKYSLMF